MPIQSSTFTVPLSPSVSRSLCLAMAACALGLVHDVQAQSALVRERPTGLLDGQNLMRNNDKNAALSRFVRNVVSIPLVEAQKLIAAKDLKGAREQVAQAQGAPDKSGYEIHVIARARLAIAAAADDTANVAELYEATAVGTWYTTEEKATALQTVGGVFYNAGRYKDAMLWYDRYADLGGTEAITGQLRGQAYYLAGDYAGAAKVLEGEIDRATQGNKTPPEIMLKLMADSSVKTDDTERYHKAAQLLAKYYPAKGK